MKLRTFIFTALFSSMGLSGTLALASLSTQEKKEEEQGRVSTSRSVRVTLFGQEGERCENKGQITLKQRKIKGLLDKLEEKADALEKKREETKSKGEFSN